MAQCGMPRNVPLHLLDLAARHGENQLAGAAAKSFWAVCGLCGRPHRPMMDPGGSDDDVATQGWACATSFAEDGSRGTSHYCSGRDDTRYHVAAAARATFSGIDPACDACVGAALLRGEVLELGAPRELGAPSTRHGTDAKALAAARADLAERCDSAARARGRG